MDFKSTMDKYKDFCYKFSDNLQKDFDEQNNFKTNIRGLKVRGTYNTRDEAEKRAKKLQGIDSDFHVFVGQVGYWLPWDPNADKIEDEEFINSQLNDMMEKYKENSINKDIFYDEQKREKVKAAKEEALRKKKEQMLEEAKNKALAVEDVKEEGGEDEEEVEVIKEVIGDGKEEGCCGVGKVDDCCEEEPCDECPKKEPEPELDTSPELEGETLDEDLHKSLNDVDPWMANKLKE